MPDSMALAAIAIAGAGGGLISSAESVNWSSSTIPAVPSSSKARAEGTVPGTEEASTRHHHDRLAGNGGNVQPPDHHHRVRSSSGSNKTAPPSLAGAAGPLYPAKHSWSVCFVNDRTGHYCHVSLITLAINIAIRAETLAKAFGIVSDAAVDLPKSSGSTAAAGGSVPSSNVEPNENNRAGGWNGTEEPPYSHHKVRR